MTNKEALFEALETAHANGADTTEELAFALDDMGVIKHPVKIGQTMWSYLAKAIRPSVVSAITCTLDIDGNHNNCLFVVRTAEGYVCTYELDDIGHSVFTDEETAVKVLAVVV